MAESEQALPTTCVANRASMRFCRSAETRLGRRRLPSSDRDPLELEEEPMKANAIEANAIPPQPDETFFPSARTKAVLSAVLSDDQTNKTRDRERGGDRPRRKPPERVHTPLMLRA